MKEVRTLNIGAAIFLIALGAVLKSRNNARDSAGVPPRRAA